jgi:hypothetical protein
VIFIVSYIWQYRWRGKGEGRGRGGGGEKGGGERFPRTIVYPPILQAGGGGEGKKMMNRGLYIPVMDRLWRDVKREEYTDKKENQIFLIYKEILSRAVAKSYMRKGFLIYEEKRKYFPIYEDGGRLSYMTLQLPHSEFPYI